jgi:hypothetical protein
VIILSDGLVAANAFAQSGKVLLEAKLLNVNISPTAKEFRR